jgi:hypothetical protein
MQQQHTHNIYIAMQQTAAVSGLGEIVSSLAATSF